MFILTEDHLKLLKRMYVSWSQCEFGAPEIDPKRPYGNSDVPGDIHEILTGKYPEDELDEDLEDKYCKLHKETEVALQIVLRSGQFKTGTYILKNPYNTYNWTLVEN